MLIYRKLHQGWKMQIFTQFGHWTQGWETIPLCWHASRRRGHFRRLGWGKAHECNCQEACRSRQESHYHNCKTRNYWWKLLVAYKKECVFQICKFFLDAVEKSKYGWFWQCPNGTACIYKHALPPGFVLNKVWFLFLALIAMSEYDLLHQGLSSLREQQHRSTHLPQNSELNLKNENTKEPFVREN